MSTKTEQVLFNIFGEFMIALDLYEQLDDRALLKFLESVTATFTALDRDVLDRYREYLKAEIERENEKGAFMRANALEDLIDVAD